MPVDPFAFFKRTKGHHANPDIPQDSVMSSRPAHHTTGGRGSTSSDPNQLVDAVGRLSLGSRRQNGRHSTGGLGFTQVHPNVPPQLDGQSPLGSLSSRPPPAYDGAYSTPAPAFPNPEPYDPIGSLSRPSAMPMPSPQISQTMWYAQQGDLGQGLPPIPPPKGSLRPMPPMMTRPKSDSGAFPSSSHLRVPTTPQRPGLQQTPNSAPAKTSVPLANASARLTPLQTPTKRPRAASSPPSPTGSSSSSQKGGGLKVQCSGTTKLDKRCTRMVAITAPLARLNGEDLPHYCHQHLTKSAFEDVKFRSHKDPSEWVVFKDWIPDYLQEETKELLRKEMMTKRSPADVAGYIYTFEIDDETDSDLVHLKVGRAVKLTKRLAEWDKQCQSKQTHLRGFWPSTKDADDGNLARGRVQVGEPGSWCHKLERLVHLELADLALNAPYLEFGFPNVKGGTSGGTDRVVTREPCPDCGSIHKEIFSFPLAKGRYKGREWEAIVKPVIEKWGGFVEAYV